jgi:hypothetical protein
VLNLRGHVMAWSLSRFRQDDGEFIAPKAAENA